MSLFTSLQSEKCPLIASTSLASSSVSGFRLFSLLMISDVPLIQREGWWWWGGWISRAVLTSPPPLPRQRQHGDGHYISAPTSSFVIEIVGAVLSSACFFFFFFFSWGPHLTLPNGPPFNFSNGEQPESLCDGSKPHCGLTRTWCRGETEVEEAF